MVEVEGQEWFGTTLDEYGNLHMVDHAVIILPVFDDDGNIIGRKAYYEYFNSLPEGRIGRLRSGPPEVIADEFRQKGWWSKSGKINLNKDEVRAYVKRLDNYVNNFEAHYHVEQPFKNPDKDSYDCIGILERLAEEANVNGGRGILENEDGYEGFRWKDAFGMPYPKHTPIAEMIENGKPWNADNSFSVLPVTSISPEDKFGLSGYDPEGTLPENRKRYVQGDRAFTYKIDFWNKETAPAPTQDVYITDDLDLNLDWDSFSFGEFGFLKWKVSLEPGQYFNVDVDLRPDMDLIVNVEGTYDPATGNIRWEFHSLDPITREPPEDPMAGFLPPITDTAYEIGWVTFTVNPKQGLPTGTEIRNQAWVKFDVDVFKPAPSNPDSEIPGYGPYLNTIDAGAPTSSVSTLSATQASKNFLVTWTGSDDEGGSGIKDYDIHVSDNGSPYTFWVTSSDTSATFPGEFGHQYSFYSRARDNVGNLEDAPEEPDAATTVGIPDVSVTPLSINFGSVNAGSFSDQTVTVKNEGTAELVLNAIESPTGPFARIGGDCSDGKTLNPNESCTVIVRFAPTFKGDLDSSFSISSNDPDPGELSVLVSLSGKGVEFLVSPEKGTIGTEITFTGSGFGTKKGKVYVGDVALKVLGWTNESIRGLLTKVLFPGKYAVKIYPKEPKEATPLTEAEAFEMKAPEIVSVTPPEGEERQEVTIHGSFFGTKKGKVYLEKDGVKKSCKVTGWTMTEVKFAVPKGLAAGAYKLVVENKVGRGEGSFTVK